MSISESGSVYINRGYVISEGGTTPSGNVEVLVECDNEVKAKLITWDDNGTEMGCLWLAGKVLVGTLPPAPPVDGCWHTILNSEGVRVVQIDDEGNLVMQGMLHTELSPMPTIYNWPYKSGGGPHYD